MMKERQSKQLRHSECGIKHINNTEELLHRGPSMDIHIRITFFEKMHYLFHLIYLEMNFPQNANYLL